MRGLTWRWSSSIHVTINEAARRGPAACSQAILFFVLAVLSSSVAQAGDELDDILGFETEGWASSESSLSGDAWALMLLFR